MAVNSDEKRGRKLKKPDRRIRHVDQFAPDLLERERDEIFPAQRPEEFNFGPPLTSNQYDKLWGLVRHVAWDHAVREYHNDTAPKTAAVTENLNWISAECAALAEKLGDLDDDTRERFVSTDIKAVFAFPSTGQREDSVKKGKPVEYAGTAGPAPKLVAALGNSAYIDDIASHLKRIAEAFKLAADARHGTRVHPKRQAKIETIRQIICSWRDVSGAMPNENDAAFCAVVDDVAERLRITKQDEPVPETLLAAAIAVA